MRNNIKHGNAVTAAIALLVMTAMVLSTGSALASYVTIGNPGNAAQGSTNRDHSYDGGDGYGAVGYTYEIGVADVTRNEWDSMPNSGSIASASNSGDDPVGRVNIYQASAYANWKTSGDPDVGLYDIQWNGTAGESEAINWHNNPAAHDNIDSLLATHDTVYALPTADEWHKAAYYDGSKYRLYANGGDDPTNPPPKGSSADDEWNYGEDAAIHAADLYGLEQNGTRNMMGNVMDWMEDPGGAIRGGHRFNSEEELRSSYYGDWINPSNNTDDQIGFRLVAVPEPGSLALLLLGTVMLFQRRRRYAQ